MDDVIRVAFIGKGIGFLICLAFEIFL